MVDATSLLESSGTNHFLRRASALHAASSGFGHFGEIALLPEDTSLPYRARSRGLVDRGSDPLGFGFSTIKSIFVSSPVLAQLQRRDSGIDSSGLPLQPSLLFAAQFVNPASL